MEPKVISQQSKTVFFKAFFFLPLKENITLTHHSLNHLLRGEKHRKSLIEDRQELLRFSVIQGEELTWLKAQVAYGFLWKMQFRYLRVRGEMFRPARHVCSWGRGFWVRDRHCT